MTIYERLREEVSIFDLFDSMDHKYLTKAKPSQISCPFHGADAHPSARVYPDTNSFRCFTCSKSWNVVTYWAEINDWWTQSDKLDIGRSIDDLCYRFNIDDNTADWESKFYSMRKEFGVTPEVDDDDKRKLATHYAWKISQLVHEIDSDQRGGRRDDVLALWDDFDTINLSSEVWRDDLITWYKSAKVKLYEEGL